MDLCSPLAGDSGGDSSLPLFVYLKSNDGLFDVMDTFRADSCPIAITRPPKGDLCKQYCKDGWLILYSGGKTLHFFNLFTRVRGDFPSNECMRHFKSLGFSACPGSSDCMTVGIYGFDKVTIWYFLSGDKTWESAEFDSGQEEFLPSTCPLVYYNGGFHFLDIEGSLGVFKLVGRQLTWQVYGSPQTKHKQFHSFHLVVTDAQLFSVFIDNQVKSLGNHMFFISRSSAISTVARGLGTGNRIYLSRLRDNCLVFHSLETHEDHVLGTEFSMENFCPSKEP